KPALSVGDVVERRAVPVGDISVAVLQRRTGRIALVRRGLVRTDVHREGTRINVHKNGRNGSMELTYQGQVAGRAIDKHHIRDAVAFRAHVPHAIAEDAEVGFAIAIPVEQHRNVWRNTAESVRDADNAGPAGVDVPDAVAVDDQVRNTVAVDITRQRHIAGYAAEVECQVDQPVQIPLHVPSAGAVDDNVVKGARTGKICNKRDVAWHATESHNSICGTAAVRIDVPHAIPVGEEARFAARAYVSTERHVRRRADPDHRGPG